MIKRYVPSLSSLEPRELDALQHAYERLKAKLKQKTSEEEQALAHTLWECVNSGASLDEAERVAAEMLTS